MSRVLQIRVAAATFPRNLARACCSTHACDDVSMKLPTLNPAHGATALLAALVVGQLVSSVTACLSLVAADRRAAGPSRPPRPVQDRATAVQLAANIESTHLFGAAPATAAGGGPDDAASAVPSQGDYLLKGIIQINQPGKGIAIIARADGHQAVYQIGQSVETNVSLRQVLTDAVLLLTEGKLERLTLPHGAALETLAAVAHGASASGNSSQAAALSASTQTTLQTFGLSVIRDSAGTISGLSGTGADAWQRSGLLPTDVIVSIDGQPVGDVLQQPAAIDRSAQAFYTVLSVLRDGNPVTVEVRQQTAAPPARPGRHRTS
jgi:type II secretory pathway component PulC